MAIVGRIGRLFRGFLSLFISGIEEANPEALMEAAKQEFRGKMTNYNLALARMAGVAERLKSQVNQKILDQLAFFPSLVLTPGIGHSKIKQPGFASESKSWTWGGGAPSGGGKRTSNDAEGTAGDQ